LLSEEIHIIKGCLKHKRKDQELLYQRYYGYAMSICLRYCYSRDEALEVLNDSFLKIFENISGFNLELEFKPWLRRIIVNTAIDYFRKNSKIKRSEILEPDFGQAPDAIDNLNVEDIIRLLNELPEIYRITFNLYEIEGYKHEEIAEILNIAVSSSRSNLTRAKRLIREAYGKLFELKYHEAI